jgi:hypothetical protein
MSQHYHKTTEGMMDKIQETLLGPPQQHTPIGVLFYPLFVCDTGMQLKLD